MAMSVDYGRGRVNKPGSVSARDRAVGQPFELEADVVDVVGRDRRVHRLAHLPHTQRMVGLGEHRHDLLVGDRAALLV
ncbi:hypothetical protein ACGH52_37690 [Streptomyces sp. BBFR25]|uniref:hypothetical protein n=1 Tax=Streptomyces sp. BBFR25 TaxID=3372855 RepID=UPI0037DC97DD